MLVNSAAVLPSASNAVVPFNSFSFMSCYCIRPGPRFQSKLNIYLVNDVKAGLVWSIKSSLTVTFWERKNKQGLTHTCMCGWMYKHMDICSFFLFRGDSVISCWRVKCACRFPQRKNLLWKIVKYCKTFFYALASYHFVNVYPWVLNLYTLRCRYLAITRCLQLVVWWHPPQWNKVKSPGETLAGAVKPCLTFIGKKCVLNIPKEASSY